jgi:hypothetical protein
VVLAEDETDVVLCPPLRACWSPRGHPQAVTLSGRNDSRVRFGTLNLRTGHLVCLERKRGRGEDVRAFLAILHAHYRSRRVALLLDKDSSHTATASQMLAAQYGIRLEWRPSAARI